MHVSAIEGHRLWATTYDSAPNPLLALETRTIIELFKARTPKRFIDVACGTGRWMLHFRKAGATVFGVDACSQMLIEAGKHPSIQGRVIHTRAETLPFADGLADLAFCSFAASYIRDFPRVLTEMARVCVHGARIVVSDMHSSAIAAGWRRSFRLGESTYELEYFEHSIDHIRTAGEAAGLKFQKHLDAHFGEPEHSIFERAGKKELFATLSTVSAVSIDIWSKP